MPLEFGLTPELSNTQFAPLAALGYAYQQQGTLKKLVIILIAYMGDRQKP